MHPADLIPAARRISKPAGETPDIETSKAPAEETFADILAGIPSTGQPVPDARGTAQIAPEVAAHPDATPDEERTAETPTDLVETIESDIIGSVKRPEARANAIQQHNTIPAADVPDPPAEDTAPPAERPEPRTSPAAQPETAPTQTFGTPPAAVPDAGKPPSAPTAPTLVAAPDNTPVIGWRLEADAPAATTTRADTPAPAAQPVARQIAAAVTQASSGIVEIRLDPPELGRVQIRLEPAEEGLRAIILAERPETQDLLRRNAPELTRDLNAAGYARVSLDFAAGGERAPRDMRPPAGLVAATGAPETTAIPAVIPIHISGGLDIRL